MLVRELSDHGRHEWLQHLLDDPSNNLVDGMVMESDTPSEKLDPAKAKLSKEEEDRPKVKFLTRQAKLLRKSNKNDDSRRVNSF